MSGLASVIIVTYNHEKYIQACLTSVLKQNYPHEIIIVDNGSQDLTVQKTSNNPKVKVIETHANLGYGCGNNIGAQHARGDYFVFLNPDTIVSDEWLSKLIAPVERTTHVITTPKILT
jgi:GT2 family glycosyltransferase